jgi:hypothetical protein
MKYKRTTRTSLLVVIILISTIWIGRAPAQISESQERASNDSLELVEALRNGGIRAAAKLKGRYIFDFDAHWNMGRLNSEALTKKSMVVVVGTVIKNLGGRLDESGHLIVTDYEVVVDESIKGSLTKGRTITVSLLGGSVEFDDGTSAELRTPTFEHVKPGGEYALFLTVFAEISAGSPDVYTLTGGPQGLVELMSDGTLKSHGRPTDPIALETKDPNKGKNKNSFLNEVRKDAVKWPDPGKWL